jgi:hypothetical protein
MQEFRRQLIKNMLKHKYQLVRHGNKSQTQIVVSCFDDILTDFDEFRQVLSEKRFIGEQAVGYIDRATYTERFRYRPVYK